VTITLKRIYLPPDPIDGARILVERLWPRGVSKAQAAIDHWAKDVAPSPELRRWFGHDHDKWDEFVERYLAELEDAAEELESLKARIASGPVTFVFAARDTARNSAVVLKAFLEGAPPPLDTSPGSP
jgi:uncharacterized protein YeaO (DUF488 family)